MFPCSNSSITSSGRVVLNMNHDQLKVPAIRNLQDLRKVDLTRRVFCFSYKPSAAYLIQIFHSHLTTIYRDKAPSSKTECPRHIRANKIICVSFISLDYKWNGNDSIRKTILRSREGVDCIRLYHSRISSGKWQLVGEKFENSICIQSEKAICIYSPFCHSSKIDCANLGAFLRISLRRRVGRKHAPSIRNYLRCRAHRDLGVLQRIFTSRLRLN